MPVLKIRLRHPKPPTQAGLVAHGVFGTLDMNSDEIRRRRIENLAQLERQQAQSVTQSDSAERRDDDAQEQPRKEGPAQTAPLRTQSPAVSPVRQEPQPKVQPQVQPRPAQMPAQRPAHPKRPQLPTVAFVFGGPESESTQDWSQLDDLELDSLIWDRLTGSNRASNALTYLMTSYGRLASVSKGLPDIAKEVRETVVRFAVLSATAADDEEIYADLGKSLLTMAKSDRLDSEFLKEFFAALEDDTDAFNLTVTQAFNSLPSPKFADPDATSIYATFEALLDVPGVAELVLQLPAERPLTPALLTQTMMARLLTPSVADGGLLALHGLEIIVRMSVNEAIQFARDAHPVSALITETQFRIIKMLIRKSANVRRLVLDWFVAMLDTNHGQTAMNRTPGKVSSFGLMLNSLTVLLRLSEPFVKLDAASVTSELAKVSSSYFTNKVSYDVSDETKVLAAQDAQHNSRDKDAPLNFVTECFFLTAGFMHYGLSAAIQALDGSMRRYLNYFEAELENADSSPRILAMPAPLRRIHTTRTQHMVALLKSEVAGITAQIEQSELIRQSFRFAAFSLAYAMYTAQGSPARVTIDIPWPSDPPEAYSAFPEFMLEAPLLAARHVLRTQEFMRNPTMIENSELLVNSCIFYMSSPRVLRNPYLRSKFVEILYFGGADIPLTNGATVPGAFASLFTTSDTCQRYLLPALMSAFIDIEHTGRSSQFYEKFSVREIVSQVFKVLWRDPHYIRQLVSESKRDSEFFVQFVALLLSDATYLLDESLGKLLEVRNLQNELEHPGSAAGSGANNGSNPNRGPDPASAEDAMEVDTQGRDEADEEGDDESGDPESEPSDPASRLRSAESAARNLLHFAARSVDLLSTFTGSVPRIFSTPEIVDRFAVMLNYNLAALVGPRCRELKVREPARLGFHPRQLLTDLVIVYLNLRNEPPFPKSLAKDERSYRHENFMKAHDVLTKYNLLSPIQLDQLQDLAKRTSEAWKEAQEEDEDFGDDIPDEYLDPLMFTVMENPVTLPTSKVNIDFSTIKTHLLSDQTDPFNRVPLKIEQVIPNPELKKAIEEYRRNKKQQRNNPAE